MSIIVVIWTLLWPAAFVALYIFGLDGKYFELPLKKKVVWLSIFILSVILYGGVLFLLQLG